VRAARTEEIPLLRLNRALFAVALACTLSSTASALVIDFSLSAERVADELTLTVSLDTPADLFAYEFWIQYDANELEWDAFNDLSGVSAPSTPAPGGTGHFPGGMKVVGFHLLGGNVPNVMDLFSISFVVANPISDGAFDDFRIFHSPEGCELLADGCNRVPPQSGCDPSTDAACDDLNPTGFLEGGDYEKGNPGFEVEVGIDGQTVLPLVPEPSIGALLLGGLVPLWLRRRR